MVESDRYGQLMIWLQVELNGLIVLSLLIYQKEIFQEERHQLMNARMVCRLRMIGIVP